MPERAKKYRERNFRMREWVQRQEGRAGFIDYESLSLTPGAPPTTVHDKHYMCYVTWPQVCYFAAARHNIPLKWNIYSRLNPV